MEELNDADLSQVITMKDINRFNVLKDLINRQIKGKEAAMILNLSYVHVSRLKQKVRKYGIKGLMRKKRTALNKTPQIIIEKVIELRKRIYSDFNILHFNEKLAENHKIYLSRESLRSILIKAALHSPRKKRIVHRQRRRMPKAGMMLQMDSSLHQWLEHIPEKRWLIAAIDDATNEIPYACFFKKDTLFNNMHVLRTIVELKGRFLSLYVDKASHFTTTRHSGIHYSVNPEPEDTQIERALSELDITLIPANSPQAKGRIEVKFKLLQDRLVKEMRLAKVKNYSQANRFLLRNFLPWHNSRFMLKNIASEYHPLSKDKNMDTIFCVKKQRIVNNDNTVQILGQTIQIPPNHLHLSFARRSVEVCILSDRRLLVLYKGSVIACSKIRNDNIYRINECKIDVLLNHRSYVSAVA